MYNCICIKKYKPMKRLILLCAAMLALTPVACKKDSPANPSSPVSPVTPDWKSFVEKYFDDNMAYFGPTEEETNYSGAYYTGDYTSPFKTYLNKTDEEIQAKLTQLWNHYFFNRDLQHDMFLAKKAPQR